MAEDLRRTVQVEEVIMNGSVLATIRAFTTRKKLCLYVSLLLLSVPPIEAEGTQPNILFIVVDNQPASILGGLWEPGCQDAQH